MKCRICDNHSKYLFSAKILQKYNISYFKCPCCDFLQTEESYWLQEAYAEAIANLDLGLATRNLLCRDITSSLIKRIMNKKAKFLDYGGGYGLFVRLMRDYGFDYYRQDTYCDNIFAKGFDISDIMFNEGDFELLTAFELFEHFSNPMDEIRNMLHFSESIFFSTELQPHKNINYPNDWWYFSLETGQHIAFYSLKTLRIIAEILKMNLLSDGKSYHLLTRKKQNAFLFEYTLYAHHIKNKLCGKHFNHKPSLLKNDSMLIKKMLYNQ
jgi:hypothetical protein